MALSKSQIRSLELYREFRNKAPTDEYIFRRAITLYTPVVIVLLLLVSGYIAWNTSELLVVIGVFIGLLVRDIVSYNRLIQFWPTLSEILRWERIDELLGHQKEITPKKSVSTASTNSILTNMELMNRVFLIFKIMLLAAMVMKLYQFDFNKAFKKETVNYSSIAEHILETYYNEGFSPTDINYSDEALNQRKIFLTTDLDEKQAEIVMKKLLYLDRQNSEAIDIFINTNGGSGGIMLSNFLRKIESPVNTYALDWCSSAGAELLASGTGKRYAFYNSEIVVHIIKQSSDEDDDREYSIEELSRFSQETFWKTHASLPENFYPFTEGKYFYLNAKQALAYAIIDSIIETDKRGLRSISSAKVAHLNIDETIGVDSLFQTKPPDRK